MYTWLLQTPFISEKKSESQTFLPGFHICGVNISKQIVTKEH